MRKLLLFVGAANFAAAAVATLAKGDVPSKGFWLRWAWVGFSATLVTLVAPPIQTWVADRGEKKRRKALERERSIREFLTAALVLIHRSTNVDCTKTGVQAFFVGRKFQWKRPFWFNHQRSVSKAKLTFSPPPSGIVWTEGKGLIGRCWAMRDNVSEDLRQFFAPHMSATRPQWDALAPVARYGMTFDEFERTKHHYGIVAAAPILDSKGRYVGCVSFDTPPDCPAHVDMLQVQEHLRTAAVGIEQLLASTG